MAISLNDFAKKIKEVHPEYSDRNNTKLARAYLEKFPQYRDKVYDPEAPTKIDSLPTAPMTSAQKFQTGLQSGVFGDILEAGSQKLTDTAKSLAMPFTRTAGTLVSGAEALAGKAPTEEEAKGMGMFEPYTTKREAVGAAGQMFAELAPGAREVRGLYGAATAAGVPRAISQATIGGAAGLMGGASAGLQTSGQKNLSPLDTVSETAMGGVKGGVGGLAAGMLTGAIADKWNAPVGKDVSKAADMISPDLNKSEKTLAAEQGRITPPGLLKESKVVPTQQAQDTAKELVDKGIINTEKSFVDNAKSVKNEIANVAKNEIKPFLESHNRIFNEEQITSKLNALKSDKPIIFSTDVGEKFYQRAIDAAITFINENKKNTIGLWQARQEFDDAIENAVPRAFEHPDAGGMNTAVNNVRRAMNDYITELSGGDSTFKDFMSYLSRLYEAKGNLSLKAAKDVGTSGLKKFLKSGLFKGIEAAAAGVGVVETGKALLKK